MNQTINGKLFCYLSESALQALRELVAMGMDEDLAFAIVEQTGGEEIYSLPQDEEEENV